jgi:hypothetical protein
MLGEIDVLRLVSERLGRAGIDYMLTGSFAYLESWADRLGLATLLQEVGG